MYVQITHIDETKNNFILSEREAWVSIQLFLFPILHCSFALFFQEMFLGFSFSFWSSEISSGQHISGKTESS